MKSLPIIFAVILILILHSCSTVKLKYRDGKDILLNSNNYGKLMGSYSNFIADTNHYNKTLFGNFQYDTIYRQKELIVNLTPIDNRTVNLELFNTSILVDSLTVKGRYSNGYFRIRREWHTSFIAGPFLWILGDNLKYLGLTKENKLVIINSGGGGVMLFFVIPVFAAGGGQFENEYERIK